jgi:hypothetical protein
MKFSSEFRNFIRNNRVFYKKSDEKLNTILILSVTNSLVFNTILLKFGKVISEIEKSRTIFIPFLKPDSKISRLAKSFCLDQTRNTLFSFFCIMIIHSFSIFKHLFRIKDALTLESYCIDEIPIGKHIYDFILIRHCKPTLGSLSIKYRIDILICLFYYYLMQHQLKKYSVKFVLTLDTVYIEGVVYELCKRHGIKMYTGFDIDLLTLHFFEMSSDYDFHCRTPDIGYIRDKFIDASFKNDAKKFLEMRFSGNQNQHDAKRAFSQNKRSITRKELITEFALSDGKIILVLPHIFCDAPHAFPEVFYRDYECWLVDTLKILNNNDHINVIVKEHPSADLYGEKGYLGKLIGNLDLCNVKLLSDDINSKSLFEIVDLMLTCGGTAAMEYAFHGVPVILASNPAYGNFNFVNKASNIDEYHELLKNISSIKPLSQSDRIFAGNLLYLLYNNYGIDKSIAHLDFYVVNRGEDINLDYFFSHMAKEKNIEASHLAIKKSLIEMKLKKYKNLYKN